MKETSGERPFELIQLTAVSKQFGDGPTVLDQIDLSVSRNDLVALIGPSGCGKSTLLKLIAQLSPITSGTLKVGGGDGRDAHEKLGYVFQDANLLPWRDTAANIALPLELKGAPRRQIADKVQRLLALVGLSHASKQYPRQLSGGMRMRVSIARALATDPELLLLDEPFGALDEMTRDDLNESLLQMRAQSPWTGVFVTHSVTEAVFMASRVIIMAANPGRIYREIAVPFAFPRVGELRQQAEFTEKVREVTAALHSLRSSPHDG